LCFKLAKSQLTHREQVPVFDKLRKLRKFYQYGTTVR